MILFINDIIFVLQSVFIIFWEYLMYLCSRPIDSCVKNVSRKLGNINMLFVKAFQSISSNSQLLTTQQIEFLSSYTDNVPFGEEDIDLTFRDMISKVNNDKIEKLVVPKYSIPIKSGIIALIYEGYIGKQKVIIKVARKNIRNRIENAIRQINHIFKILSFILNLDSLNIDYFISENKSIMIEQTDFKNELENILMMRDKFKNIDNIVIPKPYREYTDAYQNIIVMEYLEGKTVMQIENDSRDIYSKQLANFALKGVLYDRVIHADLHPGNVVFMKDKGKCKLGILDYGVILKITKKQQNDFINFANSYIVEKNYRKAFDILLQSFTEPLPLEFSKKKDSNHVKSNITDIIDILNTALHNNNSISSNDIYEINNILFQHNYRLTKEFCKIEVAMAISDGICKQLNGKTSYIDNITDSVKKILIPDICAF